MTPREYAFKQERKMCVHSPKCEFFLLRFSYVFVTRCAFSLNIELWVDLGSLFVDDVVHFLCQISDQWWLEMELLNFTSFRAFHDKIWGQCFGGGV